MATPKQQAERILEEVGADVLDMSNHGQLVLSCWTPVGVAWKATGCHNLAIHFYDDRPAGWRALLEDLKAGTEPCTNDSCDTCDGL